MTSFQFSSRPTDDPKGAQQKERSTLSSDLRSTSYFFYLFIAMGVGAIGMHTGSTSIAATPLLWALSCLASGAAVGFLFGIPKILQTDKPPTNATDSASTDLAVTYRQQVNTNLEEISDWLTKIIVGLGLIQLKNIPLYLSHSADVLAASMAATKEHKAFALALIIYFSLVGFLFGYLSTRLFLAGAFSRADQAAADIKAAQAQIRAIDERLDQVEMSEEANALIRQAEFLRTQSKLDQALIIYKKALNIDPNSEDGLIGLAKVHRKLGNWDEAISTLSTVIERNPKAERPYYNRACYKNLSKRYSKEEVLADLQRAVSLFEFYKNYARNDEDFLNLCDDPDFQRIVQ